VKVPVRATVLVEEGVAPLVLALSEMDAVILDSSQGGPERDARVRFRRRDGDVAGLAMEIAELLAPRKSNLGYELRTNASAARGRRAARQAAGGRGSGIRPGAAYPARQSRLRAVR